jgi:hypothetical protein
MKMPSSAASRESNIPERPAPQREADVLKIVVEVLRGRLPASWAVEAEPLRDPRDAGVDAILRLGAPGGGETVVLVQAKRLLNTRDVPYALDALQRSALRWGPGVDVAFMLAARYLAPATRERIAELGGGYADATGNLLLAVDRPALFLRDRGANRDPWRGPGRPRGTLQGPPAARVVRALIDFAPPYTVPDLVERSKASTGATYRVVEFLEEEGLVERQRYGPITDVRWRRLLERWSEDYGFGESNTVETFLEPRGLQMLGDRLIGREDLGYVVTGSMAAERIAPYAPTRLATIYVDDIAEAVGALALRSTESGANVALASGPYDVVFERLQTVDGLKIAAPSQIAVDLLTGPGRNPSEAIALLDWMERDERTWRQ